MFIINPISSVFAPVLNLMVVEPPRVESNLSWSDFDEKSKATKVPASGSLVQPRNLFSYAKM